MDSEKLESTIAIDFGTTNSIACIWRNGIIRVIPGDKQGGEGTESNIIPSFVEYTNNKTNVGRAAKTNFGKENKFVVGAVKRIIGKTYKECEENNIDKSIFGCEYVKGDDGYPYFIVSKEGKRVSPIEVASEIFKEIKKRAEAFGGRKYHQAYVSVPANFKNHEVKGIIMAARMAGLEVLKSVTEPTAAAMSWCLDPNNKIESGRMLVYDFGGGTFDVSLIQHYTNKGFQVVNTGGDPRLGGNDIDSALMKYLIKQYQNEHGDDIRDYIMNNRNKRNKYRSECENVKILLTNGCEYDKDSSEFYKKNERINQDLAFSSIKREYEDINVTPRMLDETIERKIKKTIDHTENLLGLNEWFPGSVGYVFIVGGSSHLHLVKRELEHMFCFSKFPPIDVDEAVATGVMRFLYNDCLKDKKNIEEKVVVSYGIDTKDGVALVLKRGHRLGTATNDVGIKPVEDAKQIDTIVYQWEGNPKTLNTVEGVPIAPKEECIEIGHWCFRISSPEKHYGIRFQLEQDGLLKTYLVEYGDKENRVLSDQSVETKYGGMACFYVCFITFQLRNVI